MALLEDFVSTAVDRLGAGTLCSITLAEGEKLIQVASNDPRAAAADQVESDERAGPCILAMQQLSSVWVEDIAAEERWPRWRQVALGNGFRSALALPAYVDDRRALALNLYAEDANSWTRDKLLNMDLLAQGLAIALRH